jgi:hypothetical protein
MVKQVTLLVLSSALMVSPLLVRAEQGAQLERPCLHGRSEHANISQTDTYLNAARLGLHESMKRFDDFRCKTVAKNTTIEHRLVGNEKTEQPSKDLLH